MTTKLRRHAHPRGISILPHCFKKLSLISIGRKAYIFSMLQRWVVSAWVSKETDTKEESRKSTEVKVQPRRTRA